MRDHCLNCGAQVADAYCPQCGQKKSTKRFSLKNVITDDFIKGVLELDKGLFYTIKELMVNPGHSIRQYVAGKRVNHYNYFTLILVVVAIDVMILGYAPTKMSQFYGPMKDENFLAMVDKLTTEYAKILVFCTIPLYSIASKLFFGKANQNFAEHLVANSYRAAGEMLLSVILSVCMVFIEDIDTLRIVSSVLSVIIIGYSTWFYYQYFSIDGYRKFSLLFRSLATAVSLYIVFVILMIIYGVVVVLQARGGQ